MPDIELIKLMELVVQNKDVFGSLLLLIVFVLVFIPFMIRQQNINKKLQEDLNEKIAEELRSGFNRISLAVGKNVAQDTESNIVLLDGLIAKSNGYILGFIRKRLEQNDIQRDPESIKRQIRSQIDRFLHQYCFTPGNKFNTSIGLLGDATKGYYEVIMEGMLEDIFGEFFKEGRSIDKKIELIDEAVLQTYQTDILDNIRSLLNKN